MMQTVSSVTVQPCWGKEVTPYWRCSFLSLPVVLSFMARGCSALFLGIYESAFCSMTHISTRGAVALCHGQRGLECRYEGSQRVCFKGFLNVWSLCSVGTLLFTICPSLWNFLGFYCPLLKAPVTMVTPTPCKIHDGSEYNLKWEHTFQQSWLQQPLKDELCKWCCVLNKIVTSRQKGGNTQLQIFSYLGKFQSLFHLGSKCLLTKYCKIVAFMFSFAIGSK